MSSARTNADVVVEDRMTRRIAHILGAGLVLAAAIWATGCSSSATNAAQATTEPAQQPAAVTTATTTQEVTKLKIEDEVVGTGAEAKKGDTVTVDYTGWLTNGTKFDSSKDRNQPFVFSLGAGQVIAGWDQGVVGMKVGGKRKLTIPPELGYGAQGAGGAIPPNATLVFEVELHKVN